MQDGGLSILSIIHLSIMSTIYLSMYLSIYFAIMSTIIYYSSPNQAREMQAGERRETPWAAAIETSCTAASIAWRDGRGAVRNADESLPPEHQVTEPDRQGTTTEEEKQGKLRQEYPGPSNKGADTRLRSHAITPLRDSIQLRRTRHSNSCGRTRPIRNYSPHPGPSYKETVLPRRSRASYGTERPGRPSPLCSPAVSSALQGDGAPPSPPPSPSASASSSPSPPASSSSPPPTA